jgi:hypothetical protein
MAPPTVKDPSPQEIRQRAAEVRARWRDGVASERPRDYRSTRRRCPGCGYWLDHRGDCLICQARTLGPYRGGDDEA